MIETQESISEKFRSGILAPIKQKLKVEVKKEGGDEDEVEVEYHGMCEFYSEKILVFDDLKLLKVLRKQIST